MEVRLGVWCPLGGKKDVELQRAVQEMVGRGGGGKESTSKMKLREVVEKEVRQHLLEEQEMEERVEERVQHLLQEMEEREMQEMGEREVQEMEERVQHLLEEMEQREVQEMEERELQEMEERVQHLLQEMEQREVQEMAEREGGRDMEVEAFGMMLGPLTHGKGGGTKHQDGGLVDMEEEEEEQLLSYWSGRNLVFFYFGVNLIILGTILQLP